MTTSGSSSSPEIPAAEPVKKVGPYEAGLFASLGFKPAVHQDGDEHVARLRFKGEIYEGSSLQGRDAAIRDLVSELPERVAERVTRHLA